VLGTEAYRFQMQYNVFKMYLQHNRKPRFVILSLDSYTLHEDKNPYYYQQFLPYLDDSMIRQAFQGYAHEFTVSDHYLPLYKYRGERTQIIVGLMEFLKLKKYPDNAYKGFGDYDLVWDHSFDKFEVTQQKGYNIPADKQDINEFEVFLNYCRQNGIVLFLVYSPEYIPVQKLYTNRDRIIQYYRNSAAKYSAVFIDFSKDSLSYDKKSLLSGYKLNKFS
jgi:hypothetical protein